LQADLQPLGAAGRRHPGPRHDRLVDRPDDLDQQLPPVRIGDGSLVPDRVHRAGPRRAGRLAMVQGQEGQRGDRRRPAEGPRADRLGREAVRGVGGTRNCDWWFTEEAVFLDTAGRYTTQQSDRDVDAAAWKSFLQLLKKSRPRRPINGVLVTISVGDLLQQPPAEREPHAQALRSRVQELYKELGVRIPVYVLVTK